MVSDFVAPSPYEPSLKDCGTLEITSSDSDDTKGMIIIPITKPTPKALSEAISKPTKEPRCLINGATVTTAKNHIRRWVFLKGFLKLV